MESGRMRESGEMPEGWDVAKLSDIGEVSTGKTPSTSNYVYWNGEVPFITPIDIQDSIYVYKIERHVSLEGAKQAGGILPKGAVLVVCIGSTIGKAAMTTMDSVTNQQINSIICNKEVASPNYALYAILFKGELLKSYSGIATVPIIKKSLFEQFKIPLPPLPEQCRIAEVLGTVDSAIQKVGGAIESTERLKKGLMQRLLTRGIGHERFKESEVGRVPEEWEVARLGDVADDFVGGGTPSTTNPDYWNGKIAWMTSSHINGRIVNSGQRLITEKGLKESSTHLIPKDNLLVATRVGIGKAAINSIDVAISQDLTGVIIKKNKANADYIYWFLLTNLHKLKSLAQGSTIKGILKDDLANLKIPLPPLSEQRRIAEILSAVDRKLELERRRKEKLERVKMGLMNELLTGRKRVKVENDGNI